jgi:DNA-binding winged helix-turn-helix (wHTH) protein
MGISIPSPPTVQSASLVIRFGRFQLLPAERLLLKDGMPVSIGGRALDILVALSARAGELVSKADLIAQVWPNTIVEEGSLRFHIATLRKVLHAGCDDSRVICTVPGRGYQLVVETSFSTAPQESDSPATAAVGLPPAGGSEGDRSAPPLSNPLGKEHRRDMAPTVVGSTPSRFQHGQRRTSSDDQRDSQNLAQSKTTQATEERNKVLLFGPFELSRKARVLKKHGTPVCLGGRALDLLIALIERPYEVVTKRELMEDVWPDFIAGEWNLRFQIGALRRALGDGQTGHRYITNVPGQGYCFVTRVTIADQWAATPARHTSGEREGTPADRTISGALLSIAGSAEIGKATPTQAATNPPPAIHSGTAHFAGRGSDMNPPVGLTVIAPAVGLDNNAARLAATLLVSLREQQRSREPGGREHLAGTTAAMTEQVLAEARAPRVRDARGQERPRDNGGPGLRDAAPPRAKLGLGHLILTSKPTNTFFIGEDSVAPQNLCRHPG